MRFSVVLFEYKNKSKSSADTEYFVMRLSGILLILLSFVLSGVIYISISQNIAVKYDEITYLDILNKDLKVMDSTATSLCRDNNIPLVVFGIDDPNNIVKAAKGEKIGTIVK